jgi:hypothetical protein
MEGKERQKLTAGWTVSCSLASFLPGHSDLSARYVNSFETFSTWKHREASLADSLYNQSVPGTFPGGPVIAMYVLASIQQSSASCLVLQALGVDTSEHWAALAIKHHGLWYPSISIDSNGVMP